MNIAMVVIMFFIVCLPFLHKYSLFFWIALFIIKNIMGKKFIISEDERNRILGLHETAKNNYGTVISEQYAGVAFGAEQNGLKMEKIETKEQGEAPKVAGNNPPATSLDSNYLGRINNMIPSYEVIKPYAINVPEDVNMLGMPDKDYDSLKKGLMAYNGVAQNKINLPVASPDWKKWYIDNIGVDFDKVIKDPNAPLSLTPEQNQKLTAIWKPNGPKLIKLRQALEEMAKYAQTNPNINVSANVNSKNPPNKNFEKKLRDVASSLGIDYPGLRSYANVFGQYAPFGNDNLVRAWYPTQA
jgi:hypothetical protein